MIASRFRTGAALLLAVAALAIGAAPAQTVLPGTLPGGGAQLPNGWKITPAGKVIGELGDLVTNAAVSPDGKVLATVNSGFLPHGVDLFDVASGRHLQHVGLPSAWLGLAWSPDGRTLFVSGGNASGGVNAQSPEQYRAARSGLVLTEMRAVGQAGSSGDIKPDPIAPIYAFPYAKGRLDTGAVERFVETANPKQVWWSGVAYLPAKRLLYALNRGTRSGPGSVVVFDRDSRRIVARIPVEEAPYQALLTRDGKRLFVSNWSSRSVSVIDTATHQLVGRIAVGANPNDLKLAGDGRLFVACSNDNSVHVIDTRTLKVIEQISTTLTPHAPEGSTPDALAIDDARHLLYVANADNNSVAVVNIEHRVHSAVAGFIPTGWYPAALALADRGATLFVGNAKGQSGHPDPLGPATTLTTGDAIAPPQSGKGTAGPNEPSGIFSIGRGSVHTLQKSSLQALHVADIGAKLVHWTRQVVENTPYHDSLLSEAQPPREPSILPRQVGAASPIKHVIYIIKENRTYDQVFGDLPGTNGDPRLTIFGEKVTPNQHALAKEYVAFDNLYADGEVSADGHYWSTAAYATDFYEKQWPALYGGISAADYQMRAAVPSAGFIWDLVKTKGLTYRTYEEGTMVKTVGGAKRLVPRLGMEALAGHISQEFRGDIGVRDTDKLQVFLKEFREYEKGYDSADPEKRLPNFIVMRMMEDHTMGTRPGYHTPVAMVANNDWAIGQLVDAVSHSRYWPETAIFVIEDDAQDGSDHVDARRTVGLVISPYVKRGVVDSTLYSTSSMLRSMELLLGLPPMSQYDAAAMPMYAAFGATPVATPFTAIQPLVDVDAMNAPTAYGARESARMDFSEIDRAPMHRLNEIIWKSIRGADSPMPAPVHRFRPLIETAEDADER